jgi:HEAT repeat protein
MSNEDDSGAAEDADADSLAGRLDEAADALEAAETEADLDDVEATLDGIETELEEANLPEPDDDEEDPREDLEDRVSDLRDDLEEQRGPYVEDVASVVESAGSTVSSTRWTDDGTETVVETAETHLETMGELLDDGFKPNTDDPEDVATAISDAADALAETALDPDDDADTIADLLETAEALEAAVDDAEEWSDLTVREQFDHEGFYDVLTPENRKDFPPEWSAIKAYEKRNKPEPILFVLEQRDADFMVEYALEALKRMGPQEAFEEMHQRAQKRDELPVEILGKIGDDRAIDTLHDFIDGGGDHSLQKTTLRAIGEIGSEESTQPVANRLADDDAEIRSAAARSLGLIGDTRAIDPLADVLADDDADEVRGSAAWALNQIGTERAREVVRDYRDDRAYLVQAEAEKAT